MDITTTGSYKLSKEEYQALHKKADDCDKWRERANRWQGLIQSLLGNASRVAKEMQQALADEIKEEVNVANRFKA